MKRHTDLKVFTLLALLLVLAACGTVGQTGPAASAAQGVPWYQDIQNWTPYQRANFFMATWEAQKADYDAMNAMPNKSPALLDLLKIKYQVLEQSRVPVRTYVASVKDGGLPDAAIEQQIIGWLRQLQLQALQKTGG